MRNWSDFNETKTVPDGSSGCFLFAFTHSEREAASVPGAIDNGHGYWNFWESHYDVLYQRCLRWLNGNHADTEDTLSTARIKVWENLQHNPGEISNLQAWMVRIVFNLCMDLHRQRTRQEQVLVSVEETGTADETGVRIDLGRPDEMFSCEIRNDLRSAVVELPSTLQVPFILHACHEISYGELAQLLGLSEVGVRQRVHRARTLIREQLNDILA